MKDFEKIRDTVLTALSNFKPLIVYLYGSCVSGRMHPESDIDIAFYTSETFDSYTVFLKAQEIAQSLGRDVDLVQLRESSTVFQNQVITKGIVLYRKDEATRQNFELAVLKKYMRLNEERADLLESYGAKDEE